MHYIIGCGGGGSWLFPALNKIPNTPITLIDGDKFEEKNMDRQLFPAGAIGENKATALAKLYPSNNQVTAVAEYFRSEMDIEFTRGDWLFCCADNHAARRETLLVCDRVGCRAVIAANEYTDAEAYYYEAGYEGTSCDPRKYYPRILTDMEGDPLAPRGCVGLAQEISPQLVLANYWAVAAMLHLWWFHARKRPELDRIETEQYWPVHSTVNVFKWSTVLKGGKV